MNNLILSERADTFTDVTSTWKDVEMKDLIVKLLTDGNNIDN